jgi:hypothetical protein
MKQIKFTFKTERPTGSWRAFGNNYNIIKFNKKEVGNIGHKKPFSINLMVIKEDIMEDSNPNCKWKWIELAEQSNTLQEAKDYLNSQADKIISTWKLYSL